MFCNSSSPAPPDAPAHCRRHQWAPGVSLLPQDILLLLLPKATLSRQTRTVWHSLCVRVLPPEVPDQELPHDPQEPPAPRLQRHAEAAAQDFSSAKRSCPFSSPPVRSRRRRPPPAAAAWSSMTTTHGITRPQVAPHSGPPASKAFSAILMDYAKTMTDFKASPF